MRRTTMIAQIQPMHTQNGGQSSVNYTQIFVGAKKAVQSDHIITLSLLSCVQFHCVIAY